MGKKGKKHKRHTWKLVLLVAVALVVAVFGSLQVKYYLQDQRLKSDFEELVVIPDDWELHSESYGGNKSCFGAVCRNLKKSYQYSDDESSRVDILRKFINRNSGNFDIEHSSGLCTTEPSSFDFEKCNPVLVTEEYRLWIHHYDSNNIVNLTMNIRSDAE